jgi:hypothetical protein
MIFIYIITSYLVMLGVMIESYDKIDDMKGYAVVSLICSPIVLPILIGMMLGKK